MADASKINNIETGDIAQVNNVDSNNIERVLNVEVNFSKVPIGLIIPFNDISIPSGWERFSNADDKMIIGAGNSYSPGNNGGSNNFSLLTTIGSSTNGNHMLASSPYTSAWYGPWGGGATYNDAGNHSHQIYSGTYTPDINNILLIKANKEHSEFPIKGITLSNGNLDISGLTNILNNNYYLQSNSSISSVINSKSLALSSSGSHSHFNSSGAPTGYSGSLDGYTFKSEGAHTPPDPNFSLSESIKKIRLSAWTNASQKFGVLPNMIGMYESLTPPEGWVLCNGLNGTPDLRDYFVQTVSGGSEAAGSGTNYLSISLSTLINSTTITHDHRNTPATVPSYYAAYHASAAWTHTHTLTGSSGANYLPPYYALSFIMKVD